MVEASCHTEDRQPRRGHRRWKECSPNLSKDTRAFHGPSCPEAGRELWSQSSPEEFSVKQSISRRVGHRLTGAPCQGYTCFKDSSAKGYNELLKSKGTELKVERNKSTAMSGSFFSCVVCTYVGMLAYTCACRGQMLASASSFLIST